GLVAQLRAAHREQQVGLEVARLIGERLHQVRHRLGGPPRAFTNARPVIAEIRKRRTLLERAREVLLRARVLARVEAREAEMAPRLRRETAREAVIRIARITHLG